MILDVLVGFSSLELLDDFPVSVATGNVEGGVSVPVLGVHKRFPVVPVQERGHKVRVTPVTGVVQWSLKILHKNEKQNPIKNLYNDSVHYHFGSLLEYKTVVS